MAGEASPRAIGSIPATKAVPRPCRKLNLTDSPCTIPGCTYEPRSITPGAKLPYQKLFPRPAVPAHDSDGRAGHATFDMFSIQFFPPAVKQKNRPERKGHNLPTGARGIGAKRSSRSPGGNVLRDYFISRVHRDIDAIMDDMREAHRGRSDSAPKNSVAEELKRDLEEVAQFNGSKLEQLIMLFCKQTKLRYNKLTKEEKQWLARIAQKSELLKSSVSQRGRKR